MKGMKTGCCSAKGCPVAWPGPKSSRSSTGGCEKWGEKQAEAEEDPSSNALFRMVGAYEQVVRGNGPLQVSQRGDHPQPRQPQAAWGHWLPLTHVKARLSSPELLLSFLKYLLSAALRREPGIGARNLICSGSCSEAVKEHEEVFKMQIPFRH